jgi:ribonuclease D
MTQDILTPITTSAALAELCKKLKSEQVLTVDTEFMRERTYYPQLCLVQIAGDKTAATIDALAPDIDWEPFWDLMRDTKILKVFHAPRQDIEIFVNLAGVVPQPLFDTQIAAMACGFTDQVSYAKLAEGLTGTVINKEEQFTDWTRRPLRPSQIEYALQDVTVLREVYHKLKEKLEKTGRFGWLAEDMSELNNIEYYRVNPEEIWQRLKLRTNKPACWMALKLLSAWREREAIRVNRPRQMVLKDDVLSQLALSLPDTKEKLEHTRNLPGPMANGRHTDAILAIIAEAKTAKADSMPPRQEQNPFTPAQEDQLELLKLALKITARQLKVAPRLIADSYDLESFILGRDNHLKHGWRWEVFGESAEKLTQGKMAVSVKGMMAIAE